MDGFAMPEPLVDRRPSAWSAHSATASDLRPCRDYPPGIVPRPARRRHVV